MTQALPPEIKAKAEEEATQRYPIGPVTSGIGLREYIWEQQNREAYLAGFTACYSLARREAFEECEVALRAAYGFVDKHDSVGHALAELKHALKKVDKAKEYQKT